MANIALLNRCNLRCPYCFADNYIADEGSDISLSTFKELLDFSATDREIGIIGGEPLLHKQFDEMAEILTNDYRFSKITVFTNGVFIDKHIDALSGGRIRLLVNVNSGNDIGSVAFDRMDRGLELLFERGMGAYVSLGVNVYKEEQDFSDIIYLIKKYGLRHLRLSVVIPKDKSEGGIPYFLRMKPTLMKLYEELVRLRVCPCYDCNAIPECVYTEQERELLARLPFDSQMERDIFMGKRSVCSPVIDLYPDYTATRCFGCYDMLRADVRDFDNITDLRNYFFMMLDSKLVHSYSWDMCQKCYKYKTFGCFGGCLCYKSEEKK
ncbi:MAG: radical SAM protein [Clostridia bacterium]|nr:radical SAM protein [Clostridia bacterium]